MQQHLAVEFGVLPQSVRFDLLHFGAVPYEVVRHQESTDCEKHIDQKWSVADDLVAQLFRIVEHQG